jgi:hypothetical protein
VQPQDSGEGLYEGLEYWIGSAPTSVPRLQFFVHLSEKKIKSNFNFFPRGIGIKRETIVGYPVLKEEEKKLSVTSRLLPVII